MWQDFNIQNRTKITGSGAYCYKNIRNEIIIIIMWGVQLQSQKMHYIIKSEYGWKYNKTQYRKS